MPLPTLSPEQRAEMEKMYGDTLTTQQANDLFDTWCPERYAQGFLLYKLYTYAAAVSKE